MRKISFINDHFYHVYNRGTERRDIFMQERDHVRFLIALYLFNDTNTRDYDLSTIDLRGLASYKSAYGKERKPLVDIIHWALMPNHFHLVLRQRTDKGISSFMQKVGTGFSMYFNKKYERTGRLFEGPFKVKSIDQDEYFSHLSVYVPLNPLGLRWRQWKEDGVPIKELNAAKNYLRAYRWSSFSDYFGKSAIPDLVAKKVFFEAMGHHKQYGRLIDEYLARGFPAEYKEPLLYEA